MKRSELINTYSIIAIDDEAGVMGGAVQSHYFSVGGTVIWAEPGTGVIATQAMVNMDYGPDGLTLLRSGMSAKDVLGQLIGADEAADIRQAAALDCSCRTAAHTGGRAIRYAGHRIGPGWSVQANMMLNDGVPEAMAEAYEASSGPLERRLLAALVSAEENGGDIRGMQSAAIIIVPIEDRGCVRDNLLIDLRVEDNPAPLAELERLLDVQQAYRHADLGDLAVEKGELDEAMRQYGLAEKLQPDNAELQFWKAVSLLNAGRDAEANRILESVYSTGGSWKELLDRLPDAGILDKKS